MEFYWILSHIAVMLGFLLAVFVVVHIMQRRNSPAGTIAWLVVVVLVPYVGVPLYLIFGGRKIRKASRRKTHIKLPSSQAIKPEHAVFVDRLLRSYGLPGATGGNRFSLCRTSRERYDTLVNLIENAQKTIWITMFLLERDEIGRDIINRLARKAKAGLDVKVLLDSVGSMRATRRFLSPLREAGGEIAFFMPLLHRPFRGQANLRNHRKIIIADERRVIAGGANIGCYYIAKTQPKSEKWIDLSFLLEGPAVTHYVEVFNSDWEFATKQRCPTHPEQAISLNNANGITSINEGSVIQVLPSGPDIEGDLYYEAIISSIFAAQKKIWVATPYFIPDRPLIQAFKLAAHRGVDVRILVPQRSNHLLADIVRGTYLRELQEQGCKILLYTGGMMHAKVFLMDDKLAMIGSPNMDMRSLFLDYEIAMFTYSKADIAATQMWLDNLAKKTITGVKQVSTFRNICEGGVIILSPLL